MSLVCTNCNASISEDDPRCPSCGQPQDGFLTIPPPRFSPPPSSDRERRPGPPRDLDEPPRERRPEPPPRERDPVAEEPARPAPPRRKPRPAAPQPQAQAPPQPITPPPVQNPPQAAPPPGYYYPPQGAPQPAPAPAAGAPGKLRRWLISQLGGQAESAPHAPVQVPVPPAPGYAYPPGSNPAWPAPGAAPYPPYPAPPGAPPMPGSIGAAQAGDFGPMGSNIAPSPVAPAAPSSPPGGEEGAQTIAFGADLAQFKLAPSLLTLQILDRNGQWRDWTTFGAGGLKVGRTEKNARFSELNSMAVKHMRIGLDGTRIVVEDLGSVNGIYLKIQRSTLIEPGTRFRVGAQVIEFQAAEPMPASEPLVGPDGEAFWSRDLDASAYLQLIRADGTPGLRFPLTSPLLTTIGRESRPGKTVDIALPNDEWASGQHAQIRRDGDQSYLEDLGSRNGTFIQLKGRCEVLPGDVLLVGRVILRAMDPSRPPR